MFARVTKYKMKPGSRAAATDLMNQLKDKIMALPGLHQFVNAMNEDGSGYIVSLIESREISDANQAKVREIWGQFADHLEAMPTPEGYDVIANWNN